MPKEPKPGEYTRETDLKIIKTKLHPDMPQVGVEAFERERDAAKLRMQTRELETRMLGVEVQYNIAKWTHEVSNNTVKPKLLDGKKDTRDGRQYLLENAGNLKNAAATMALFVTGNDPTAGNVQIGILERTKSAPIKADDVEVEVMREIE